MTQKFTQNDLIRYIYKETSVTETLAIQEAMDIDFELYTQYQELFHTYQQLPKAKFSPSTSIIQNILQHSQRTALQAHR